MSRSRAGWWLYVAALSAVALFIAYSFVGVLVLGLFGYYATRPICERISRVVDSDRRAAMLTVLVVLFPTLLVVLYTGAQLVRRIQPLLDGIDDPVLAGQIWRSGILSGPQRAQIISALQTPAETLGDLSGSLWSNLELVVAFAQAALGTLVLLGLALALAYGFLSRADTLSTTIEELLGGRDTTAYRYAVAVDSDLQSIFFGNFLFVLFMALLATVTYAATNLVAPEGLAIPMVLVLGFLTGLSSLVPLVVGKLVYVPVVALLAVQALGTDGNHLPFVGGVFVVYLVVLDVLPQSVLQPYISGRQFDRLLLFLAYVLGPILFGWYGFFLLPILFVLLVHLVDIVLPELLYGDGVDADSTDVDDGGSTGSEVESTDPDDAEPTPDPAVGPTAPPTQTDEVDTDVERAGTVRGAKEG
ncbi:AI-2E family transporter [Halorarius litoreus]|uniref:AI-2E family transporter n=1 Tax=Halorarius litoreus TaxID=2962676 RepID=UPI0020CB72AD|nr:AI-2E family transporter [Halorarius litoreus]